MDLSSSVNLRLSSGKLFQAYIVSGPKGSGKTELAKRIALQAVCSEKKESARGCGKCQDCRKVLGNIHPDVITAVKREDKKEYVVEDIRALIADSYVMPNEAERKVYIFAEGDKLSTACQNVLLKTLEEPPRHAVFIIVTENSGTLLDTVRSRCVEMSLTPGRGVAAASESAVKEAEELMSAIASGNKLSLTEKLISLESLSKAEFGEFASQMRRAAVSAVKGEGGGRDIPQEKSVKIAEIFSKVLKNLDFNVSTGHIVGFLMSELL